MTQEGLNAACCYFDPIRRRLNRSATFMNAAIVTKS